MPHPEVTNGTPFFYDTLFPFDEEGRPLLVPFVKATYVVAEDGKPSVALEQAPICAGGEFWGDPEKSSYRYEPEVAPAKVATDVVLIGHAYAPDPKATEVNVGFRVGPMQKVVHVVGDRFWIKSMGRISPSRPQPLKPVPLLWENSFGGWDRSHEDPKKHTFEPRNPVGAGFRAKGGTFEEGVRLPNLEDPRRPLSGYHDTPAPVGFGFIGPNWQPRAELAGTYDKAWEAARKPLLPKDFDRRYFNAAPLDQVVPGFLAGNEPVVVANASPQGRVAFHLPGVSPPRCHVEFRGGRSVELETRLDTLILNLDENLLLLIWRACHILRNGPQDLLAVEVKADLPVPMGSE